jgi:hypothetical protein
LLFTESAAEPGISLSGLVLAARLLKQSNETRILYLDNGDTNDNCFIQPLLARRSSTVGGIGGYADMMAHCF